MAYDPSYQRRWIVTVARMVVFVVVFDLGFLLVSSVMNFHGRDDIYGTHSAYLDWVIWVPVVWVLIGGAVVDHWRAGGGPVVPAILHAVGVSVIGFVGESFMYVPFYGWAGQTSFDVLEAMSFVICVVPILVALSLVASLAAALIPGSIPSRDVTADPMPWLDRQRQNDDGAGERRSTP
jgi:hypothetical protein